MKRNKIRAILLPSASSRSYSFSVPRVLIYFCIGTLLASWIVLGIGGYLGIRLYRDHLQLKKENTRLIQKRLELNSLRLSIENIQTYERLIRNSLDLQSQRAKGVGMGQGGMPSGKPPKTIPEKSQAKIPINPIVQTDSAAILEQAEALQDNLQELVEVMHERRQLLGHTPSLLPVEAKDYWISSGFGWRRSPFTGVREFHNGVDICARRGTPIVAPGNGWVAKMGYHKSKGKYLEISHGWGLITTYAHLLKFNVTRGQEVKRGQVIAYLGSTGRSTGSHLHYEIKINGKAVDPMRHIIRSKALDSRLCPLDPIGGDQ